MKVRRKSLQDKGGIWWDETWEATVTVCVVTITLLAPESTRAFLQYELTQ